MNTATLKHSSGGEITGMLRPAAARAAPTVSLVHRPQDRAKFSRRRTICVPSAEMSPPDARLKETVRTNCIVTVLWFGKVIRLARYKRAPTSCFVTTNTSPEIGSTSRLSAS